MKTSLKTLAVPVILIFSLLVWVCAFLLVGYTFLFQAAGTIQFPIALVLLLTRSQVGLLLLLLMLFLLPSFCLSWLQSRWAACKA